MNLQKYTQKSIEALRAAQSDATERGNSRLEPEHVFLALMRQEGGLIPELIKKVGVAPETAVRELEDAINKLPRVSGPGAEGLYISRACEETLNAAENEAEKMRDEYVSVEHIMLGLFDKPIVILNHNNFYDHLIEWVHLCHSQHFLRHDSDLKLFTVICTPQEIFPALGVKQTTPN